MESDLLRSIRLMKEKRDEKIAAREVDPISALDKAAESKRRVLIDKNFPVRDQLFSAQSVPETVSVASSVFEKSVKGPHGDKESAESSRPAAPDTARKEKWRQMAEQREIWDQELREATQIEKVWCFTSKTIALVSRFLRERILEGNVFL